MMCTKLCNEFPPCTYRLLPRWEMFENELQVWMEMTQLNCMHTCSLSYFSHISHDHQNIIIIIKLHSHFALLWYRHNTQDIICWCDLLWKPGNNFLLTFCVVLHYYVIFLCGRVLKRKEFIFTFALSSRKWLTNFISSWQ